MVLLHNLVSFVCNIHHRYTKMDLPREPTLIPQARRYNRTFEAPRGRSFSPEETVTIDIPAIKNTYLTKNNKLHFDMTLNYSEASAATYASIVNDLKGTSATYAEMAPYANGFFGRTTGDPTGTARVEPVNYYTKPVPFLDINGPYGFINRIQVYDYLGTTLLEDVREHDVLTAMLADFDFKEDNFHVFRPYCADAESVMSRVRKHPCSFLISDQETLLEYPMSLSSYIQSGTSVVAIPGTVTVIQHYSLDLYSFLGKLSSKFVPLHNGFRLQITFNKANIPLSFATAWGDLSVKYKYFGGADTLKTKTLDPTINSLSFSKIYLKADLLEVSPELDAKVDKLVHFQGFQYQLDFFPYTDFTNKLNLSDENRPNFFKRIAPAVMSLNKVMIGQRPVPTFDANGISAEQKLGFRIRNYLSSSDLLYNKSVINSFSNLSEFQDAWIEAFGLYPDSGLTYDDFGVEEPLLGGTNGKQFFVYDYSQQTYIQNYMNKLPTTGDVIGSNWWPTYTGLTLPTCENQGRFLAVFDTRLPGTGVDTIGGISTLKNVLEYKIVSDADVCWKVYIDVFSQHDAILKVEPQEKTTVSF